MTLREAMVTLVDATAGLPGADEAGDALSTARWIVKGKADRLLERQGRIEKRRFRALEVVRTAKNARRDARWDAWDREVVGADGRWDTKRGCFVNTDGSPLRFTTLGARRPSSAEVAQL